MLGLTLVTAITATVVVSSGTVAADQVSDLKAQAAQIAQDLVLEQLQIGADQQQYDVDRAKVQRDEAEIGSTQNQIQTDILRVTRDRKRLQAEAVSAYVNMDPSDGVLFEGNQSDTFARAEYEDVTSGDTELTIDVLHTDEDGLHAERVTLEQQEAQDQATTNQQATQASAARQTQVELNSKQSEITGQLVAAVAQQQAAQAAAAAKAVRAAQAAATAAATRPRPRRRAEIHRARVQLRLPRPPRRDRGPPPARRRAIRCSLLSSNASCGSSQAGTTAPCRREARTWVASNSASRRGMKQPNWPVCRSSSTSPRTRQLRLNRTTWPSRSIRPMASSLGTIPVETVDRPRFVPLPFHERRDRSDPWSDPGSHIIWPHGVEDQADPALRGEGLSVVVVALFTGLPAAGPSAAGRTVDRAPEDSD